MLAPQEMNQHKSDYYYNRIVKESCRHNTSRMTPTIGFYLKSPTLVKYLKGFELLAMAQ
jgi:hypothetical protein